MASNTEIPVRLEIFDSAPTKWEKIDLPKRQEAALKLSHDRLVRPVDVNRPRHQLFQQFFYDNVIEFPCQRGKFVCLFQMKNDFFC